MSTPEQLFQQFLDAQRHAYGRSLPGKLGQVAALWRVAASGDGNRESLAELGRLAHTLGGTAGTLGFVATGHAARALELLLQHAAEGGAEWAALRRDIERAIGLLQDSLPAADAVSANAPENAKDAG